MPKPGFLTRFAAKVLDFDHTALPEQQFAMIQDMLANCYLEIKGREAKELLESIRKKHLVNSVTVKLPKENLVFSSSGNGDSESSLGKEVLGFVNKNFARTDLLTMRTEKEWVMLMPWQDNLYVVKANSPLSGTEMKALAREVERVLRRKHAA